MAYNQEFFLDLASKGKSAWTAWRCDPANKFERVTFAGVDFSEAPRDQIDFWGFEFGDFADFSRCLGWLVIGGDVKKLVIISLTPHETRCSVSTIETGGSPWTFSQPLISAMTKRPANS
jgi:hypothetical protein